MAAFQSNNLILVWLFVLPFFVAGCAALFPRLSIRFHSEAEKEAMAWAPFSLGALASLLGLALTVSLVAAVNTTGRVGADYWWTRNLYHLRLQADGFSLLGVLAVYSVGFLVHLHLVGLRGAGLASPHPGTPWAELPNADGSYRAALLLAAQGCGIGAIVSADLILLVFFFELLLVCLWLLTLMAAPGQGWRLFAVAHVGGLLLLGGVLVMWQRAGDSSTQSVALLLLSSEPRVLRDIAVLVLVGLLAPIAAVPAHGWLLSLLPAKRHVALAPAALLAVVGAAVLLRLLPGSLLLPSVPLFAKVSLVLGLLSLWWGAVRAWMARDLGGFAAWLTVAQSGFLLIALAAAGDPSAPPLLVQAAALQVLLAPLAIIALWSVASSVATRAGSDALPGLSGIFQSMPVAGIALLVGGLSVAGVPPFAGFQVQRLLISGLIGDGRVALSVVVMLADLLIVAAVLSVFWQAFLRPEPPPPVTPASPWLSVQLVVLIVALLVIGIWPGPWVRWSEAIFRTALSVSP